MQNLKLLLVEDSPSIASLYQEFLYQQEYDISHVENGSEAICFIEQQSPEIILLDINLPDMSGLEILKMIQEKQLDCSVIIITAHGSVDLAVDAMQLGAHDFIVKPAEARRLIVTVANAAKLHQLNKVVNEYKKSFDRTQFHGFIGGAKCMQNIYHIIEHAASSIATAFITGESGTGKELCAEALHKHSNRKSGPFIALNCGAIPKELMESEIFGHIKGAFTGAQSSREGAASRANGGTLFLDEICEMDLDLQVKLLRFIQSSSFQKLGGSKIEKVDIRIVCATNKNPVNEVAQGSFREDLYYRLQVIPIHLPPLRNREGDIERIAKNFLSTFTKEENKHFLDFTDSCLTYLNQHPWPGNIRQLQNTIRNIVVLNDGKYISNEMLPSVLLETQSIDIIDQNISESPIANISTASIQSSPESCSENAANCSSYKESVTVDSIKNTPSKVRPLWLEEKEIIERAIERCDNNIPRAAAYLEISASTIYRKMQQWSNNNLRKQQ